MTTIVERHGQEQIPACPVDQRREAKSQAWARAWASAGAAAWAGLAVLARMGIVRIGAVELMFLFAPLVIVPLGMEVGRKMPGEKRLSDIAGRMQPVGAGLAVAAMLLPPGRAAAILALGWLAVCGLLAVAGILDLAWFARKGEERGVRAILGVARIDLAVGGAWLVASRLGLRPMGIEEPIGLLAAVHFHFAGFATATIAAALLKFSQESRFSRALHVVAAFVAGMPFVMAAGFVFSAPLKMIAGVVFSTSVAALAVLLRSRAKELPDVVARRLLQGASVAVFAGMALSAAYAVADFRGSDVLTIPQMARTHGVLNAVGFCLPGLLGWVVASASQPEDKVTADR